MDDQTQKLVIILVMIGIIDAITSYVFKLNNNVLDIILGVVGTGTLLLLTHHTFFKKTTHKNNSKRVNSDKQELYFLIFLINGFAYILLDQILNIQHIALDSVFGIIGTGVLFTWFWSIVSKYRKK